MTIYDTIKEDHNKHRKFLDILADTKGDSEERRNYWKKFYCDVKAHAAAEEETLYANLMGTHKGQSDARHSVHEHQELDKIIDELNTMDMSSPGWLNRFNTLQHDYFHHIDEEEKDIFPRAKEELGPDKSGELADEFGNKKLKEFSLIEKKREAALEE